MAWQIVAETEGGVCANVNGPDGNLDAIALAALDLVDKLGRRGAAMRRYGKVNIRSDAAGVVLSIAVIPGGL